MEQPQNLQSNNKPIGQPKKKKISIKLILIIINSIIFVCFSSFLLIKDNEIRQNVQHTQCTPVGTTMFYGNEVPIMDCGEYSTVLVIKKIYHIYLQFLIIEFLSLIIFSFAYFIKYKDKKRAKELFWAGIFMLIFILVLSSFASWVKSGV